jgi:hypothetical protein
MTTSLLSSAEDFRRSAQDLRARVGEAYVDGSLRDDMSMGLVQLATVLAAASEHAAHATMAVLRAVKIERGEGR